MNNHYSTKPNLLQNIWCTKYLNDHVIEPHHLAFRIFPSVRRLTQFSSYINPANYKWSVWIPWTATKTRGPFTWTNLHKAIPVSLTCTRLLPPLGLPNLFTWPEQRRIPEDWGQLLGLWDQSPCKTVSSWESLWAIQNVHWSILVLRQISLVPTTEKHHLLIIHNFFIVKSWSKFYFIFSFLLLNRQFNFKTVSIDSVSEYTTKNRTGIFKIFI